MTQEFVTLPREIVEQAIYALYCTDSEEGSPAYNLELKAIKELRAALEQSQGEQEPVAWMYDWDADGELVRDWVSRDYGEAHSPTNGCCNIRPLYTHPQLQREPLTDDQVLKAVRHLYQSDSPIGMGFSDDLDVARAIEAAHNIK